MNPDALPTAGAVDLEKHMQDKGVENAARALAAQEAALLRVARWERFMRRTFKGIMPAPTRRMFLQKAAERAEKEAGVA